MVSCLFHRMSDFQAYDPTPDRWKKYQTGHLSLLYMRRRALGRDCRQVEIMEIGNHARASMFCMKIDEDAGISLVCSLARAFVAIVKSQSETSHSEREFYKIRRVFKAPKFLREKSA